MIELGDGGEKAEETSSPAQKGVKTFWVDD